MTTAATAATPADQLETMVDDLVLMQETLRAISVEPNLPPELGALLPLALKDLATAEGIVFASFCCAARAPKRRGAALPTA